MLFFFLVLLASPSEEVTAGLIPHRGLGQAKRRLRDRCGPKSVPMVERRLALLLVAAEMQWTRQGEGGSGLSPPRAGLSDAEEAAFWEGAAEAAEGTSVPGMAGSGLWPGWHEEVVALFRRAMRRAKVASRAAA